MGSACGPSSQLSTAKLMSQAVTVALTGSTLRLNTPILEHTLQVSWAVTGVGADKAITALTVDLEGSLDGESWFQLGSHALGASAITAKADMFHVSSKTVTYIRANVTTLTITGSTGTVTLTILHTGV